MHHLKKQETFICTCINRLETHIVLLYLFSLKSKVVKSNRWFNFAKHIDPTKKNRLFCICYTLFSFSFVRTYCILNLLGVVFSSFFFFFFCLKKNNNIFYSVYNVARHFFEDKQIFVLCKINLSIEMLIIFHVRTYPIVLSLSVFVLDLFLREQFLVDSLEERNFSRFVVVIMNYLFFFCFFLCNLFFLLVSVYLFRAPVLLLIDKNKEKKNDN
jgi:hypothetical protein